MHSWLYLYRLVACPQALQYYKAALEYFETHLKVGARDNCEKSKAPVAVEIYHLSCVLAAPLKLVELRACSAPHFATHLRWGPGITVCSNAPVAVSALSLELRACSTFQALRRTLW